MLVNEQRASCLLGFYQRILLHSPLSNQPSPSEIELLASIEGHEQTELILSGLVEKHGSELRVKNPIYQSVFDLDWVAQQLSQPVSEVKAIAAAREALGPPQIAGNSLGRTRVASSPDNRFITVGLLDNAVKLWSLDGTLVGTLTGHTSGVLSVAFSSDGHALASGGYDQTVVLWNLQKTLNLDLLNFGCSWVRDYL